MAKQNAQSLVAQYVGREGVYFPAVVNKELRKIRAAMGFRVRVVGVRKAFGRLDFNVTPVEGSGQQWISADNVNLDEGWPQTVNRDYLQPKR